MRSTVKMWGGPVSRRRRAGGLAFLSLPTLQASGPRLGAGVNVRIATTGSPLGAHWEPTRAVCPSTTYNHTFRKRCLHPVPAHGRQCPPPASKAAALAPFHLEPPGGLPLPCRRTGLLNLLNLLDSRCGRAPVPARPPMASSAAMRRHASAVCTPPRQKR